ncbi:MAG: T9SS type A sorting domain-containing protein [Ignavibacteriota bacterium]|nr:T9SS C-terminal target domain-containing protein [Ignavibacteriota bacterium]MCO6448702.1 T9SS type A sorting domain-containing protein [Ignavibacterium album]QKK00999.1 MAG: T9SS type A sorting domain-containing protein [Ignavibacteriota bacterium]HOJ07822.1 T9SS type A sorting domain-containing protein [Ignavibacteriaceae bacterium]
MKTFLTIIILIIVSSFGIAQSSLDSGLVAYYPFNGNANDESGSGNNGTVNGASLTQDRFGINNRAYQFDGINDYISIADNPNLFSDELTISWWYKLTETPGAAWVVIGWVDGGHRYQQFFSGGQLSYFNGYNLTAPGLYFNPIYNLNYLNVWKHIVVTYQKTSATTSTTSIYVDGELKQTDNHTLAMDYASGIEFKIGKNVNGNFFKGALDDFRIFSRVLNQNEIVELYNDTTTFFGDNLIASFPFSGNADDESFLQNNGTAINAVLTTDRYGNPDNAYSFNGTDSRIQIPQNSFYSFGYGNFTMSAWININSISTARVVSAGFDQNDNIWGLGFGTHTVWGNGIRINYFVFSDNNFRDFTSNEINDYSTGEWTFIAASKTNDQIKFYQNGLEVGSAAINYPSNSNSYMSIGCRQYGSNNLNEFLNGKIDEVKIFNTGLTDQQIWNMYKSTTTAPNLIFPGDDSTLVNPSPAIVLDWDSTITANEYRLLIANDSLFNIIVYDTILTISSFTFDDWSAINFENINWKVRTINNGGIGPWSETYHFNIILTDVEDETQLPTEFALLQNYPNPFNPSTNIQYAIANRQFVQLKVYDVLGNEIATLVNEEKSSGTYEIEFSVGASQRLALTSGVYFYQLKAGNFLETKKMVFLK